MKDGSARLSAHSGGRRSSVLLICAICKQDFGAAGSVLLREKRRAGYYSASTRLVWLRRIARTYSNWKNKYNRSFTKPTAEQIGSLQKAMINSSPTKNKYLEFLISELD